MHKPYVLPASIIAIGALAIALLIFFKPTPEPAPPETTPANVKVSVIPVQKLVTRLSVTTQGTVTPRREIDLLSQVAGQILSVETNFVDGGFFETSQVLIQIDDREYQAALLRAKAQVAEAQYRLAEEKGVSRQAKREWRDLGNQNANDLFLRKPQLASAQANLESARGALDMAALNLERTRIMVPFNGRVKQTYVDLGQYTTPGSRLATVYDSTLVEIRLPLTEQQAALIDLPLLPQSMGATLRLPPVAIRASVAGEKHTWLGVLTRTDSFVDANSRMYYAIAEVRNPFRTSDGQVAPLLPGLFVEAEIEGREITDVIQLPRKALFERDKIFSLDSHNKISSNTVRVLRKSEEFVWIQAGFDDQTLVSVEKQGLTPAGSVVDPIHLEAPTQLEIQTAATPTPTSIDDETKGL